MLLTHICFDFYPPFLTRVSFYFLGWREQNHNGLKRTRYEISKFVFLFNVFFFITFKESRSSWARGHQNAFDLNWVDSIQSRVSGNRVHVSILALLVISLNRQQTFTKRFPVNHKRVDSILLHEWLLHVAGIDLYAEISCFRCTSRFFLSMPFSGTICFCLFFSIQKTVKHYHSYSIVFETLNR